MRLVERDYLVLREVERWRFCLGRHIRFLAGFSGQRATDRRLNILIEAGYLERKKIIYGIASIYYLTHKGKVLIGANKRKDKIRIERIAHDIAVLDTAIYFLAVFNISLDDITTEKELHSGDGFGTRKHYPDFIFTQGDKNNCVEIEMTQKNNTTFQKIIEANFLKYDLQYWIVPKSQNKILQLLEGYSATYPNIKIINLEEVTTYLTKYG